jgi:LruC domain-containing protein
MKNKKWASLSNSLISIVMLFMLGFSINCGNQKKRALLFPFLAVFINDDSTNSVQSDSDSIPVSPSRIQNSEKNNFIVKQVSDTKFSILPDTMKSEKLFPTAEIYAIHKPFHFKTNTTVQLNLKITDSSANPVVGGVLQILSCDTETPSVLFSAVSDSNGIIKGNFQIESRKRQIEIQISNAEMLGSIPIPFMVSTNQGEAENVFTTEIHSIHLPFVWKEQTLVDSDRDGMPDKWDQFPNDPQKSTKIRFPLEGVHTIAFEDLYPITGDGDFNDYILQYFMEKEINSSGEIHSLSGQFTHVAKGAGYRHTLNFKFANDSILCNKQSNPIEECLDLFSSPIFFESNVVDSEGKNLNLGKKRKKLNYSELADGVEILGDSSKTILSSNTEINKPFKQGYTSTIHFEFQKPIPSHLLGEAPYDLFIKVLSKKVDSRYPSESPRSTSSAQNYYEIHLPGKYFDKQGNDLYLDKNQTPWAIVIPGEWEWPLEGKEFSLRSLNSPYPRFSLWVKTKGQKNLDWYLYPNKSLVYSTGFNNSSLLAFVKEVDSISFGLLITIIAASILILYIRRRFIRE